jgi:hypothetical protein
MGTGTKEWHQHKTDSRAVPVKIKNKNQLSAQIAPIINVREGTGRGIAEKRKRVLRLARRMDLKTSRQLKRQVAFRKERSAL